MNKLIKKIQTIPKNYYTYADIRKIAGLSDASLRVALARLVKNQEITRLCQGYYAIDPAQVDYEQLACEIYAPSYLSLEWVLARAGVLSQQPATLTLVTQNRAKKIMVGNTQISYQHLKPEMWRGYEQTNNTLSATPAKALLDWQYLAKNGYASAPPYEEMNLELLNRKKLKQKIKYQLTTE